MNFITPEMLSSEIDSLGEFFDAHDIERRILRNQPVAFAQELLRYREADDILRTFSAQFSRFVDTSQSGRLEKAERVTTANLGGLLSECQQWRKRPI